MNLFVFCYLTRSLMGVVLSLLAVCFSVHISTAHLFFGFNSFNTKLIQHGRPRHLVWSWLAAVVRASSCVCGAALHCYSNTKRVYTHKTNKEGKKSVFIRGRREVAPAPRLF